MQKSNIVHIVLGKANPNRQNGVNRVVFELAMSQFYNGHTVQIWGITKNPIVNFYERPFETRMFQDSPLKFKLSPELKEAIKSAKSGTVFHLHGGFLPQLFSIARRLKKANQEYIYTPHGAFNAQAVKRSKWKKNIYINLFEKSIVAQARFVHVIGKSEIKGTKGLFRRIRRIELVPNGHKGSTGLSLKPTTKINTIHFGFLGRIDIQTKGIDILLNGFETFLENGRDGILHIAGGGMDHEKLKQIISEKNLDNFVQLHGPVFGKEKDQFLASLDYLCLTSRNEGLPGVVLEALAEGIPCIVSPETNMADFIQNHNGGFSLRKNKIVCLANALEKAFKIRNTKRYVEQCSNATRLIKEEFQWTNISNALIEKFHEG